MTLREVLNKFEIGINELEVITGETNQLIVINTTYFNGVVVSEDPIIKDINQLLDVELLRARELKVINILGKARMIVVRKELEEMPEPRIEIDF